MKGRGLLALLLGLALAGCGVGQESRQVSETSTQLGIGYMQRGDLNQAKEELEKAIDRDRRNPDAHGAMAVLQERLGQYDEADAAFQRSLSLDDEQPAVRNNYGRFLCSRGRYEEADEQFRMAIDDPLYRRPFVALANAGHCALRAEEFERAEDYLRRALEEQPQFAPALRRLAELNYERGDYLNARGYYQRLIEVREQDPRTLWLGIRIERALGNKDAEASYALRLRSDFPDSEQAARLSELKEQDD